MLSIIACTYPVVASLILLGERLELGLGLGIAVGPAAAQLLCDVAHAVLGIDGLHFGTLVIAEPEERRAKVTKYSLLA